MASAALYVRDGLTTHPKTLGKGVIVKILKPEEMPVDAAGNRADVIMDSGSTINRKNVSRVYEMYFSAAARDVTKNFMAIVGMQQMSETKAMKEMVKLSVSDPARIAAAREYLAGFYAIISPRQHAFFMELEGSDLLEWMAGIVAANIARVYLPTDNPPEPVEIVKQLEQYYRPTYSPVTYIGNSGRRVTTHEKVRIAPLYMMLLEQIGDNGSSVAYGKLQHFGVLSPVTRHEKYSSPHHNSPVRTMGETEDRIFSGYVGREGTAEMIDRSNNPQTHRHLVWNVLNAAHPTDIDRAVDRNVISLGGAKPIQLVKHVSMCSGFKPVYKKPQSFNK